MIFSTKRFLGLVSVAIGLFALTNSALAGGLPVTQADQVRSHTSASVVLDKRETKCSLSGWRRSKSLLNLEYLGGAVKLDGGIGVATQFCKRPSNEIVLKGRPNWDDTCDFGKGKAAWDWCDRVRTKNTPWVREVTHKLSFNGDICDVPALSKVLKTVGGYGCSFNSAAKMIMKYIFNLDIDKVYSSLRIFHTIRANHVWTDNRGFVYREGSLGCRMGVSLIAPSGRKITSIRGLNCNKPRNISN